MKLPNPFKRNTVLRERIATAKSAHPDAPPPLLHDPIEDDPNLADVFSAVDREVEEFLKDRDQGLGFCHLVCQHRKRILQINTAYNDSRLET